MGQKLCSACAGRGFTTESRTVPNTSPGAGSLYRTIRVQMQCRVCDGLGTRHEPDPSPPVPAETRKRKPNHSPEQVPTPTDVRGGTQVTGDTESTSIATAAAVGAFAGAVLSLYSGASLVGLLLIGGVVGALAIPVFSLAVWLLSTALKLAFYAVILIAVVSFLAALFG